MPRKRAATLYKHQVHAHTPRNPNDIHKRERAARTGVGGFNERIAVWVTAYVGTMWTAYGFSALALCGLLGVLAVLNPSVYTFVAWLSQTFIQLVLLPVIMVGQNVNSRHSEIVAEQMYHNTVRILHEFLQNERHLGAQDAEMLAHREQLGEHRALLQQLVQAVAVSGPERSPDQGLASDLLPDSQDRRVQAPA